MNYWSSAMSPRNKRLRKVINPPLIKGFKPFGPDTLKDNHEPKVGSFSGLTALELCVTSFSCCVGIIFAMVAQKMHLNIE